MGNASARNLRIVCFRRTTSDGLGDVILRTVCRVSRRDCPAHSENARLPRDCFWPKAAVEFSMAGRHGQKFSDCHQRPKPTQSGPPENDVLPLLARGKRAVQRGCPATPNPWTGCRVPLLDLMLAASIFVPQHGVNDGRTKRKNHNAIAFYGLYEQTIRQPGFSALSTNSAGERLYPGIKVVSAHRSEES